MDQLARREAANAGAHWAASSHPDPDQVWREWDDALSVALLPAGRMWDAIAMPYSRMQAVAEDLGPLMGAVPILADLGVGRCYIFTPPGSAEWWNVQGTTALGEASWLAASQPGGRQSPVGTWVQPPDWNVTLLDPDTLSASLRRTTEEIQ
ncbi:hypothetical protein ACWCQL_24300 [Streptomyces sp. NPDC002073]